MAQKRKAQDAFGKPQTHLSAFAAARLAKETKQSPSPRQPEPEVGPAEEVVSNAGALGDVPYDGHHEDGLSSDTEEEAEIILAAAPVPSTSGPFATFKPGNGKVVEGADGALRVHLQDGESAVCLGEYDVQVESGIATIYGTVLRPEADVQRVYAPSTHALPRVVARKDRTVVRIAHVKSSLRKLERLSPLFRNILVKPNIVGRSFALILSAKDDDLQRSLTALDMDKEHDAILSRLSTDAQSTARLTRIMAAGAKSSGKSTFNRILCNTLLSRPGAKKVLYLDLDPGQPEFGAPGQVSLVEVMAPLLGPSFTHPAFTTSKRWRLVRSHAIAATSFKDDPEHYVACAKDLVQRADRQYPLIINSCGWVSGVGANVLVDLTTSLDISHMVLLEPLDQLLSQSLQQICRDTVFYRLPRQPPRPSARTPAEARQMQMMAHFHSRQRADSCTRWHGTPISDWRPWVVSYAGPNPAIGAVLSYGQSPSPKFLAEVLDGSLVAIAVIDEDNAREALNLDAYHVDASSEDISNDPLAVEYPARRTVEGLQFFVSNAQGCSYPLNPRYSQCVGLALVRAIDTERRELHLVTPLTESRVAALMDKHIVLIRGGFDAPEWAYLEDLHASDKTRSGSEGVGRPWVSRREHVGIEGAVWRLRHPPMAADVR